ncbi:class I SAM-dependent methyltransferase [Streptomyces sp. NPDC056568]|uniref:class I SAM-dependent methyltransferase n=1 Tax=Streptomyces sp. NPDC056568 TaxID=3345866 RepID=UPI00367FB320
MRLAQGRADAPALLMLQVTGRPIVIADPLPGSNDIVESHLRTLRTRPNVAFAPRVTGVRAGTRSEAEVGFDLPGATTVANEAVRKGRSSKWPQRVRPGGDRRLRPGVVETVARWGARGLGGLAPAAVRTDRPVPGRRYRRLRPGARRRGAQVVAVDASRPSLDVLESRRGDRKVDVVEADFRDLGLGAAFHLVTLSRNTFFLAQTQDEKIALLRGVERHLKPSGAVFLDCTDPAEFLRAGGDATSVTCPLGRDWMVTITQTADRAAQAVMSIFLVRSATELVAFHETATWATLPAIRLPARMAGREVTAVNGSYAGEEYSSRSREMLVVLERT